MLDRTAAFDQNLDQPRNRLRPPTGDASADLATCIAKANQCYLAARRAAGESVRYAAETGQWLQRIQRLVGCGNWCRWLHNNRDRLEFSPSSASGYLRLANLPSKDFQRVANLSLREALRVAAVLHAGNRRPRSLTPSTHHHHRPSLSGSLLTPRNVHRSRTLPTPILHYATSHRL